MWPVSFYFIHVTTENFTIINVAHIIFLLDSAESDSKLSEGKKV